MAFTKADGSAGSLRDDGKIADQNYKGAMSAGGASVEGDLFDIKGNTPQPPSGTPVPSGSGKVASSLFGAYNVLDGGTMVNAGGSEWNSKMGDVSPGANASNNVYPVANLNRTNNYKALTSAGNWNIVQGKWEAGESFSQKAGGAWSAVDNEDQAGGMRSKFTDHAAYNPSAPMVISESSNPVAFVSTVAPQYPGKCLCDIRKDGPKWPDAVNPLTSYNGPAAGGGRTQPGEGPGQAFCTGSNVQLRKIRARVNCDASALKAPIVYLGYYWGFRNTEKSNGRCALVDRANIPQWVPTTELWAETVYSRRITRAAQTVPDLVTEHFSISGDPGYVPDCRPYCGGWVYNVIPIDESGNQLGGKQLIYERDFHMITNLSKSCPEYTTGLYVAACLTLSPPTYTAHLCTPVPARPGRAPF